LPNFFRKQVPPAPLVERDDAALPRLQEGAARRVI